MLCYKLQPRELRHQLLAYLDRYKMVERTERRDERNVPKAFAQVFKSRLVISFLFAARL